jgi:hypothetical protein
MLAFRCWRSGLAWRRRREEAIEPKMLIVRMNLTFIFPVLWVDECELCGISIDPHIALKAMKHPCVKR